MADSLFYWDSRAPFISTNVTAVTLATTDKAMYPKDNFPVLGGNYFSWIGKALMIKVFGRFTTAGTPGNLTIDVYYGSGADANGTIISSSAAVALSASQTDLSWWLEYTVRCRSLGATGTLFGTGIFHCNVALIASTIQPVMIPASAPAASGSVDLTAANIISVQFKRSGSTGESARVDEMQVISLN